ncbi:TRAP transporter large permease [Falsirhodobacter algicola]|uniref:TRAP transporter large permease protein n=1 Tax=Falsirhodobacter algicola TaxID=2692330 RepID=A0A8J8SL75_9RHOB|nr:TRAP transporter large permease [Falsirhodobacter algicola]QUS36208.1 TRAP transporter large permease subunit [Falsirhodobacter algicola]
MLLIAILLLAVALLFAGFEMLLVLGVPALAYKQGFWAQLPDAAVVQKIVGGVDHSTLLAIPFFIFAANLMGSGQIARQLLSVVTALVGHAKGGIGHVVVGGSMAFGSVSGSAPATVAAMGRMVYPEMRKAGYSEKFSLGLLVASAETALLIPPSITLIVYGWITGTSIAKLFAGGLAVGLVLGLALAVFVRIQAGRDGVATTPRMPWADRMRAIWAAKWALGMPIIILGGIYSGVITPTEAAAVSVVYAILVEMVVLRTLDWSGLARITEASAINTAIIFVLLAMGGLISFFVTLAQVPSSIIDLLHAVDAGWITFLIVVNICFFIAGMFVDPNSTVLVLVPPLYPVAMAFGIDPVHFGMIVTLNVCLGMITPPFGLDIFVASSTLNKPVNEIIRGVWPFVLLNLIVLLLITYIPQISLFVPRLIYG